MSSERRQGFAVRWGIFLSRRANLLAFSIFPQYRQDDEHERERDAQLNQQRLGDENRILEMHIQ